LPSENDGQLSAEMATAAQHTARTVITPQTNNGNLYVLVVNLGSIS